MQGRNDTPWQRNRLGPYRLLRRLRGGTGTGQEAGRPYTAWHHPSGRPALLVAPTSPMHYLPEGEWRLRVRAATSPAPYVALEVEQAPTGKAPLLQLADGMDALCAALEVHAHHPEAAAHLAQPPSPRRRTARSLYLWALAVVVLLALVCLPRLWGAQHAATPAQPEGAPTSAAEEALAAPQALPVGSMEGRAPWGLALDMPPRPFPGQYRVDKQGKCKGRLEEPINGGCWIALRLAPPCGVDAYEWKGACYWPSMPAANEPSSTIPPRVPPVPARGDQ